MENAGLISSAKINKIDEALEDNIFDAAAKYNLDLPDSEKPVFNRLVETINSYMAAIIMAEQNMATGSDAYRRSLHNELCVMLLGKRYEDTSKEDRKRVSNFVVTALGYKEYIGRF